MKRYKQLGLIGCGMMGGSFALALKQAGLVERVVGYNKSPNEAELAKRMGVIDDAAASILQSVMGADLVLIAVPVSASFDVFKAVQFGFNKTALIMDVGSTKQSVMQAAEKAFGVLPENFVPCHPIAGKEQAGIEAADKDLYRQRNVILTPNQHTHLDYVLQATQVWQAIGMRTSVMSADAHDAVFAAVSHFPHLLAFAYMNGLHAQEDTAQLLQMAGPGFRDFSRIAASSPEIWADILLANREKIFKQTHALLKSLHQLESAMRTENAAQLKNLIEVASQTRRGWTLNQDPSMLDE